MDIKFPISESIDNLLRYGVSGGVLLIYLLIAFPETFRPNWFDWHYFVIFSFIIGFLIFVLTRIYVDRKEEGDYYKKIIQDKIPRHIKELKKSISNVHLARALENYYFWSEDKRVDISKIQRKASYIYFYFSMIFVFGLGAIFLVISLLSRIIASKLSLGSLSQWIFNLKLPLEVLCLIIIIFIAFSFFLSYIFYQKYKKTYEDQKYIWYVTILNELEKSPENFEDFIVSVYRTNKKWKIIDKFLSD